MGRLRFRLKKTGLLKISAHLEYKLDLLIKGFRDERVKSLISRSNNSLNVSILFCLHSSIINLSMLLKLKVEFIKQQVYYTI